MKYLKIYISAFFLMALSTGSVSAQESDSSRKYHPFLSDTFNLGLGVYRPSKKAEFGGRTDIGGGSEASIEGNDSQSTGSLNFRWRFTKNWSFQGTYWATDSSNQHTLTEDFTWSPPGGGDDVLFEAGTFIGTGIDSTIARLFIGRSFFRKPNHDFGLGAGLHWIELDFFIEGQAIVNGISTPKYHEGVSASVPLPNLGIWYMYSWSPKWVLTSRLDWLDVTIEEISGSMFDASVGLNYQMSEHFGIGLAINAFILDVKVDSNRRSVGFETEQIGPRLNITWNW
jgi:hypothetical protein